MLSVFFNWIYIAITAFLMGMRLREIVWRHFQYRVKSISSILAAGLITITVYAQVFSLFYKVGAVANLVLVGMCIPVVAIQHQQITQLLCSVWRNNSRARKLVLAVSVILWCFCTSRGYMHYDSDLYHAQSIRWIEEYGIVKGLGNIHVRFAYNSSFFALSALYSMKFLCGRSLHTVNGFIALLLWIQVLTLFQKKKNRKTFVTDFARVGAFYYLTVIYSDIVAPASDYAVMCVVFFIVIKWLELIENDEKQAAPYALLCVAGGYAMTLKLTAGFILILVIKPLCILLREKKLRDIGVYLLLGCEVIVPWLARTVLISGYLLYPFPALDLFRVDWKIPAASAALDAAEIRTWGRGIYNAALADLPVGEWFPAWFYNTLPVIGKLLVLADMICVVIFILLIIRKVLFRRNCEQMYANQLLVLGTILSSYIFWQFSAPLLRYGYAYILLTVVITGGILFDILRKYFDKFQKKDMIVKIALLGTATLFLFSAVKLLSFVRYVYAESAKQAYVFQQDYGQYELESYDVNGVIFYYPRSGDRVGYDSFPAIPRKTPIFFRGETIREGFCPDTTLK
ncbi:MAG: hypothetical protein K1W16_01330 [Lachnospiraceae bacterium]